MTKAEMKRLDAIARAGCCICGTTPSEIHHVRRLGQKRCTSQVIGLCPKHHRLGGYGVAVHAGRKMWESNFGTEQHFVELTLQQLQEAALRGKL